ncbi:FUSC family protein [Gordonia rubripertincta]|uniref:FUSC family protein n=1 Tax=Gordonia rubripertincta TaxID=36822 RepID=UPI00117D7AE5|nr:FUSC family protein [Gordonia rubripertincta]TSD97747.1 FUSC family protein [Gordonia rubripertincta]
MAPPFALTALLTTRDPGAARLRKAVRGASAMAIGALVVLAIRSVVSLPVAAELSAGFLSLWATVGAVKDTTARARIITTVALLVPGFAAALLACLLHPWPVARAVAFVAIAGLAAWTTRYGPRGSALGFFGFFAFFFAVVMGADLHTLPVLCGLVVIAVASALFVRLVLVPDRPGEELRRLLRSVEVCADDLLRVASEPETGRQRLAGAVTRLSAATSAVAGWQKNYDAAHYTDLDDTTLSRRVSMLHLASEQTAFRVAEHPTDPAVAQAVSQVRGALRSPGDAATTAFVGPDPTRETLRIVVSATADLRSITVRRRKATTPATSTGATSTPKTSAPSKKTPRPDTTRFALQVMVACSVALAVGELISASRWYWAVLSAFMVFNGMATRGAILTKAVKRVQGTAVGLVIGVAAVLIIGEHPAVQYVIVVCAVFFAFYLGAISYTWTILFITIVLTNSYDLLGVLNRHVLEWRIEETLCGALVGAAAAFLILSTPTSPVLDTKLRAYFDALVDLASVALRGGENRPGEVDSDAALAAVRVLDGAEAAMLDTAASAVFSLSRFHRSMLRRVRPHLHETTRDARGLAWSAIGLARSAEHTGNSDPVEPEIEQDLVAELRRAADATVSAIEHGGVAATTMGKRTKDVRVENTVPATEPADASPVRQARRLIASVQRMRAAIAGPVRASRADEQLAGE